MIKIIFLLFFCTFFNFNVFADVKDDISKINDLKETLRKTDGIFHWASLIADYRGPRASDNGQRSVPTSEKTREIGS